MKIYSRHLEIYRRHLKVYRSAATEALIGSRDIKLRTFQTIPLVNLYPNRMLCRLVNTGW